MKTMPAWMAVLLALLYVVGIPLALGLPSLLTGCAPVPSPPPSAVSNTQINEITEHEQLVDVFQSAEVVSIPTEAHEFLVRDTNGVIWYVSYRAANAGRTRMFGWHEAFPRPGAPPAVALTNRGIRTTNVFHFDDNTVITNDILYLEDNITK